MTQQPTQHPAPAQQATGEQRQHRPHLFEPSGPEDVCFVCGGFATDHTAPRGLARLDAAGLAELRAVILRVIDDGDVNKPAPTPSDYDCCHRCGWQRYLHDKFPKEHSFTEPDNKPSGWNFAGESEAATEARMRFVETITKAVVAAAAPAVGKGWTR